jgi:succinate dehydrogenase hydrophobic anchor subunit
MERYKGSMRSGGAVAWFFQRLTAVVLFVGLLVHWVVLHYGSHGEGLTYESVAARMASPAWRAFEWLFLLFAVYHAVNGALAIVRDFRMRPWVRGVLYSVLVVLGVSLALLGSMTILTFNARA